MDARRLPYHFEGRHRADVGPPLSAAPVKDWTKTMKNSGWIGALFAPLALGQTIPDNEWPVYGRDPGGSKYSPLSEIDRTNVKDLKIAWTFRTGDMYGPN